MIGVGYPLRNMYFLPLALQMSIFPSFLLFVKYHFLVTLADFANSSHKPITKLAKSSTKLLFIQFANEQQTL